MIGLANLKIQLKGSMGEIQLLSCQPYDIIKEVCILCNTNEQF